MTYRSIAIIGDSQAGGLANHLRTELARRNLGPVTGTATIDGASTRVLLDRRKPQALMEHSNPDLVIVALGGNDTGSSSYPRTLAEFVRALRRPDNSMPEILWVGPAYAERPDVDARHFLTAQVQAATLPALGVRWFDSREWTSDGPGGVHAGDGVHFTSNAYAAQASAIIDRLVSSPTRVLTIMLGVIGGLALVGGLASASLAYQNRH